MFRGGSYVAIGNRDRSNRQQAVQLKLDPATIIAAAPGANNVVPTGSRDRASAL